MLQLENLPWWAKIPLIIGGALMSAFSNSFPQGFQTAGLILGILISLFGVAAVAWHFLGNKFTSNYVLQWPLARKKMRSPTLQAGLYICDMRFTFAYLKDRHSELTMRVFNGTCRIVEFSGLISGRIKFSAPNNTDPSRMGDLPTPAMRPDTERTVAQLKEGLLILTQIVPADEADKLIAMLETDMPIHFDLSELTIGVFVQDDRNKVERLPIWSGVSYNRGHGFGMIISAVGRA